MENEGAIRRGRMLCSLSKNNLSNDKADHHFEGEVQQLYRSLDFDFGDKNIAMIQQCIHACMKLRAKYCPSEEKQPKQVEANLDPPYVRDKTLWDNPHFTDVDWSFSNHDGVFKLDQFPSSLPLAPLVPPFSEYYHDLKFLRLATQYGPIRTFAWRRLEVLKADFEAYRLEHGKTEADTVKGHKDFQTIMKVDNHIHHAAAMNQLDLLDFIRQKLQDEGDTPIKTRDGRTLTLKQMFEELHLSPETINLDALDMQIDSNRAYVRFDKFNQAFTPFGTPTLREVFLKTSNSMHGRYFAELTKEKVFPMIEREQTASENRLSIYGRSMTEWVDLAEWVVSHELYSKHNRWIIQVPRLYGIFRKTGTIDNFQQMLDNVFVPLFEATLRPSKYKHLNAFLQQVVGVDSVDDESLDESAVHRETRTVDTPPAQWSTKDNPPYSYYLYYFKANLNMLNWLRKARGMSTLAFRPHCGEAGDVSHLNVGYLTADSINHGVNLTHTPVTQYLFYLDQIGISMSPVSNNALFLPLTQSPFLSLFQKGLNITLSTDDPCMFHFTHSPLLEEYSICAKLFRLSQVDLCEIARFSVLQSGFEPCVKAAWLGPKYGLGWVHGNTTSFSNVPNSRLRFRLGNLQREIKLVTGQMSKLPKRVPSFSSPSSQASSLSLRLGEVNETHRERNNSTVHSERLSLSLHPAPQEWLLEEQAEEEVEEGAFDRVVPFVYFASGLVAACAFIKLRRLLSN